MNAPKSHLRNLRIAIIGAGPGGLCTAIRLKQQGFEDLTILEKAEGLGGTWYHNRYPGCACDLPSFLYSFSFEPKLDWSRPYAPHTEIRAYMEHCAEKYDVLRHCRFNAGVASAEWDEGKAQWTLGLESGETVLADVVVSALGMFNELVWPEIEGIDDFEGTKFHTARWDWTESLAGKRVGVIGSAASAVQLVPEIVKEAEQVHLFQRTANWVMPKLDDPFTEEQLQLFRDDPSTVANMRQLIYDEVDAYMTFQNEERMTEMTTSCLDAIEVVEDPEVRAKLTPTHPFGAKRPLLSNVYFEAFNRPNLELVTDPIARITPTGIVTEDGQERVCDAIVIATGFGATRYLTAIDVKGRGGRSIQEAWDDGAEAFLGITTTGFPNLFMIYGPNTNNGSILEMIECQAEHVVIQCERLVNEELAWIDVMPEPQALYNAGVQEAITKVPPWNHACNGYYRSPSGRIVTQWPHSMSDYKRLTADTHEDAFENAPLTTR